MDISSRVAQGLLSIGAVFLRPQEPFTWASGIKSPIYCDNRLILTAPAVRETVERAIADTVHREFPQAEVLMGTATAGIAHAAIAAHLLGLPLVCVGGTARAALKLTRRIFHLPQNANRISRRQLAKVCSILCSSQREAAHWILKVEPERIHTMIPGLLILRHIVETFGAREMVVSQYGVREGYLCQKLWKAS